MNIALVTNLESRGLALDAKLLGDFLVSLGHSIRVWQYDEPQDEPVDLVIFCEVVVRQLIPLSKFSPWLLCNPEFMKDSDLDPVRASFGHVLCKTKEAHRICTELVGDIAVYTGFLSRDIYRPEIPREPRFVHIAGHSQVKGMAAVIDSWRWLHHGKRLTAPLTIVCDFVKQKDVPENVTVLDGISDEELIDLMNRCKFVLAPSQTEGYGHSVREAMSCNSVIVVPDAPPLNELQSVFRIPAVPGRTFNQAQFYDVSALDVYRIVEEMLELDARGLIEENTREEFLRGNEDFKARFSALLDKFKPRVTVPWTPSAHALRIAFLGNFEAPESTENLIRDALTRGLGHEVENLQENRVTLEQVKRATALNDVFLWVRTPGWLQIPDEEMFRLLDSLKARGIPTLSVHLDRFWGIPDREALIGKIPFWRTQFVWTADGGNQEGFAARGVNHFWMRPAVSELHIHPGIIKDEYRCDVGFVGAKAYHSEYPFRRELVEFLERTLGDRFMHVTNIRGHELNSFYASCRITVGDCFMAGAPRYASDRLPETTGRYGFLLHPEIEGFDNPVATYKPQDLNDLQIQIEYWLPRDRERREKIQQCAEYVRLNDTWTIRMRSILSFVLGSDNDL